MVCIMPRSAHFRVAFRRLCILLLSALSFSVATAATYYIDFSSGSNSNAGTQLNPWKSHPYMTNAARCAGALPTYSHVAGDRFIFKGGATWPNACFPIIPLGASGDANHIDYYGADQTWYAGATWAQPIFDAGGSVIPTHNNFFYNLYGRAYLTLDNFELTGYHWSGTGGLSLMVGMGNGTNVLVQNLTIHNWTHGGAPGTADNCRIIYGTSGTAGQEAASNTITGVDEGGGTYSCQALSQIASAHVNTISNVITAMLNVPLVYGNTINTVGMSWDGIVHCNAIEVFTPATIYANKIDNVPLGCPGIYLASGISEPGISGDFYVYNNVVTNNYRAGGFIELANRLSAVTTSRYFIWNNSVEGGSGGTGPCFAVDVEEGGVYAIGEVHLQNNHCVTSYGNPWCYNVGGSGCGNITSMTADHNLVTANGTWYSSLYRPQSSSAGTVDSGTSAPASTFTVDIDGASRNQGKAWDIGAYEFSPLAPAPPVLHPSVVR